jgi:signal transduction histidine kinase
VTALKGFAQLLKRRMEKQDIEGSGDLLVRMETQIARLTKLIEDLLDVSKIEAGGLEYAEERIAIDGLIQDIAETIQQTNTTHSIRMQGTSHKHVIGDSDRLGQVFINLMTNAMKYSPRPRVWMCPLPPHMTKCLWVCEIMEWVFQRST